MRTVCSIPVAVLLPLCLAGCASGSAATRDTAAAARAASVEVSAVAVSGIPVSGAPDKPVPAGRKCNLKVLSWAGFEAAASYSFDDGQPSQIQHWPELKATGVPMTFYICGAGSGGPGYVETWKEAIASGSEIGNHTLTHKWLREYPDHAAIAADIAACSAYIRNTLGQKEVVSFAYPFGETDWQLDFGGQFLLARSVSSGMTGANDSSNSLVLPIYPVLAGDTADVFNSKLDGALHGRAWLIFMFHSILPGDNWFAGVETADLLASIDHAKQGGGMWLDTVDRIGSYWYAQKMISALTPDGSVSSKSWKWKMPANYPRNRYLRVTVDGGVLTQKGNQLAWNPHGFYEISLDAGELEWRR